jgi:5-methylcytosine-specific restriction endonuclease McrA
MEILIGALVFIPLLLLVWVMVRHANRIRHDVMDKGARTRLLEQLDSAMVQAVLDRDQRTCQRCGTRSRVGVDFVGTLPEREDRDQITPADLQATCTDCYLGQWQTLQKDQPDLGSRDDDRWM